MSICAIKDLSKDSPEVLVIGIIIAKSHANLFDVHDNRGQRGVLKIVVRDSKYHFIACTVWGSDQFVLNCDAAFKIGDVITINRPDVHMKNDAESFLPQTTSPFCLSLSESRGFIVRNSIDDNPLLKSLLYEAVKPTSQSLYLSDIIGEGRNSKKGSADLLIVVRAVMDARTVNTKNGEKSVREVIVMDETCDNMSMTLWNNNYIERASQWCPMQTILHLVDVQVSYKEFKRCVALDTQSRTIITENPSNSSKATALLEYVSKLDKLNPLPSTTNCNIQLDQITEVMSVQKVLNICAKETNDDGDDFTAIVYAVITKLQMDPFANENPIARYCCHCNRKLLNNSTYCSQENCLLNLVAGPNYTERFDIQLDLTDHSGTLEQCHLQDEHVKCLMPYNVQEFRQLSENQIDRIKESFFLERFAVKIFVRRKTSTRTKEFVSILDIYREAPEVMAQHIKLY